MTKVLEKDVLEVTEDGRERREGKVELAPTGTVLLRFCDGGWIRVGRRCPEEGKPFIFAVTDGERDFCWKWEDSQDGVERRDHGKKGPGWTLLRSREVDTRRLDTVGRVADAFSKMAGMLEDSEARRET